MNFIGNSTPLTVVLRRVAWWLTACSLFMLLPATLTAQSIEDYQQMAAENNPELRATFNMYLSSLEDEHITGSLPDPELAFGYFIQPIETRVGPQQARISITQMFPWFGSLKDRRSLSEARSKVQYERFQERRNKLFLQVEQQLLDLYELEQSLLIANENLQILNSLVEISLRRYETDQASQVDVLRAQIEQEDLITQIELLKDNGRVIRQKMNALLNRAATADIVLPDTLMIPPTLDSRETLSRQIGMQNPALNSLRFQEDSSRELKRIASNDGKPSFGLGLDYIFTGERENVTSLADNGQDAILARASFRIPLFRNKYNAKIRQAELNVQSVQMQITDKRNGLESQLEATLRDHNDAHRRYKLYDQKQIQRVNQALSILMENYAADNSNFEEILRMQRKLLGYQLNRIQALTDLRSARATIDYLTGKDNITANELN